MALKFGRKTGITSIVDPRTGQTRYTEQEYDDYMSALGKESEKKSKYDADLKKYKSDYDSYYNKSVIDTDAADKAASLISKAGTKNAKGEIVTGTAAKGITQAQIDKQLEERIKKGEVVSINSPSINNKTRELLKEANYGTDISKAYIAPKNYDNYKQLYGEDFDPKQWRADVKAGKTDKYEGRSYSTVDQGGLSFFGNKPVNPDAYVPASIKKIDPKSVDFVERRLAPKVPTKIDQAKPGKLKLPKEKEEFVGPEKIMEVSKKVSMNPGAKGTRTEGAKGRYVDQVAGAVGSRIKNAFSNPNRRYDKEQKGFKSLYGGGASLGDKGFSDKSFEELKDYKKEVKGATKRGIYEKGEAKVALGEIRSAIGFKRAERSGKNVFFEGANKGFNSSEGMGKRYMESSTYDTDRKLSLDNATNRNTISRQEQTNAAAVPSNSRLQKDKFASSNEGSSKREIRQGARTQQKADEILMRSVDKKIKNK